MSSKTNDWRTELLRAFKTPNELLCYLEINPATVDIANALNEPFPCLVPRAFARRMKKKDVNDPLLRQVLPLSEERISHAGYTADPLHERKIINNNFLLKKYQNRALLITSSACAVHCRYCFRRHQPSGSLSNTAWTNIFQRLTDMREVNELILSGGDPLMLNEERLQSIVGALEFLPHIKRLRIHSRLPVVIPGRINAALLNFLYHIKQQVVLVLHINHANEINDELQHAVEKIDRNQLWLFNQAVLLKGVNDTVESQVALSYRLAEIGVIPYYLHQLDRVAGASHFAVADTTATRLYRGMASALPGYLLPRLVRDIPGGLYKVPLMPAHGTF